jgi:hypothetical protein
VPYERTVAAFTARALLFSLIRDVIISFQVTYPDGGAEAELTLSPVDNFLGFDAKSPS